MTKIKELSKIELEIMTTLKGLEVGTRYMITKAIEMDRISKNPNETRRAVSWPTVNTGCQSLRGDGYLDKEMIDGSEVWFLTEEGKERIE